MRKISKKPRRNFNLKAPKLSVRRFFQKIKNPILFIGATIFFLLVFLYFDAKHKVKQVIVEGGSKNELKGSERLLNKRIWLIDNSSEISYLKNLNYDFHILTLEKKYPDKILISVKKLVGIAYLETDGGFYLLDEEGTVIDKSRELSNLQHPLIKFYQRIPYSQYQLGSKISSKDIVDSIYFLKTLENLHQKVISIDITGFNMLGLYTDKHKYLFSSEKDLKLQKYQLEESISQISLEGIEFIELDFRFDKPVVRF